MALKHDSRIVIIGAGAFGLSTALELARKGYTSVTVLDRSLPPVADGSSVDISRIVRSDYSDADYAALAREAYELWLSSELFRPAFHPTPFLIATQLADRAGLPGTDYVKAIKDNINSLGLAWRDLNSAADARTIFPVLKGELAAPGFAGYISDQAGWADAAHGISLLRDECSRLGVSFIAGAHGTVTGLNQAEPGGRVQSVSTASGLTIPAELVVLAAGAWTASIAPLEKATISTGQIVGYVRLSDEQAARLAGLPIYMNMATGVFMFPPHPQTKQLKVACHGFGYTNTQSPGPGNLGTTLTAPPPKTVPRRTTFVPEEGISRLRAGIVEALGQEFEGCEFEKTVICWYTETPTGDFIVDRHPLHNNLVLATGGNGHAYKMLPVLGKYVVQAIEGTLSPKLREKWKLDEERLRGQEFGGDGSRGGPPRREFTDEEKLKL